MQLARKFALKLLLSTLLFSVPATSIVSHDEIVEKSGRGLSLLSFGDGAQPVWKTESEKFKLIREHVRFFDVTDVYELKQELGGVRSSADAQITTTYPPPSHEAQIKPIVATLAITNMQNNLTPLTAFHNRFYNTSTGVSASNYILDTVKKITSGRNDITVLSFPHSWPQSSVIVRIAGANPQMPLTIIGSHMDSINLDQEETGRAPGADDDGTGVVILIETLRALVAAGFKPRTPVEFQFYAAEEIGLRGSQAIATDYKKAGKQVKAMMQLDMAGYTKPGSLPVFALSSDFIDKGLNDFLTTLVPIYSNLPVKLDQPCGYPCSDHASWYEVGYPASAPYEAVTGNDNPYRHGANDTVDVKGFSWDHALEFAKVAVAFVYEMAI